MNASAFPDFLRKMLGISPDVAKQIDKTRFYLATGIPVWLAVAILVASFMIFGAIYWKDGKRPSWWIKSPMLLLRLMAISALLVILLQPMLWLQHSRKQRSRVLILTDNSQSMGFKDPKLPAARRESTSRGIGGGEVLSLSRGEIVQQLGRKLYGGDAGLVRELSKKFDVRAYNFSSKLHQINLASDSTKKNYPLGWKLDVATGASTQIGTTLKQAMDDNAGQRIAGAIILSDGGNNLGDEPGPAADRAKRQGTPISTLGIGDPTPTKDVSITEVLADQVVRKDGSVQVFAGIAHRGYSGQTVSVSLTRNGSVIGTKSVALGAANTKQTVTFAYVPKEVGDFIYQVSVTELAGEITHANNHRRFVQRVVGKKLKILYVDGEPRWEYRYLKNAILRDEQIQFSCILTSSEKKDGGEGNVPVYKFPEDEKALFEYDLIVLGDVPRSYFGELQLRNLRRFVEDKGGSLIIISGEKHMPSDYRGSSIEAIFPVNLSPIAEQIRAADPFQWELTPAGKQDPLLRMAEDPAENERIWREMPGMLWQAGVERTKPAATALVVNSQRSNSYGKRVMLAVQPFGAGKCLMSMTDSTWLWRWRVGDRYFYRYWGQALRAMTPHETPDGNRFAQVNTDRSEYSLSERITVHARLLDAFYHPISAPTIQGSLTRENGNPTPVTLHAIPGSPGLFSVELAGDRVGKYQVSLASPANPSAKASATYLVQSVELEKQQPEMNEPMLKKIAASGGGHYYQSDELKKWVDSLKPNDLVVTSETEIELWNSPLLLLLFVVPLCLEWVIRKRSGLM